MASAAVLRSIRRRDVASSLPVAAYRCLTGNAKPFWAFSSPSQSWVSQLRPFCSNDISGLDLGSPSSCVAAVEEKLPNATVNHVGEFTTASAVAFNQKGECLSGASAKRQGVVVNPTNPLFQTTRFISTHPQKEMRMLPDHIFRASNGIVSVQTNGQQLSTFSMDAGTSTKNVSEVNPKVLRPLSPHLPIYKPQSSSTSSIFNRISGAYLSALVIAFYLILVKMGSVCLTYVPFYLLMFYLGKLILLSVEVAALAMAYHVYKSLHHLVK